MGFDTTHVKNVGMPRRRTYTNGERNHKSSKMYAEIALKKSTY